MYMGVYMCQARFFGLGANVYGRVHAPVCWQGDEIGPGYKPKGYGAKERPGGVLRSKVG